MRERMLINKPIKALPVLVVTLLFMMLGTALELVLLDHYEDLNQLIPLLCIGSSLSLVFVLLLHRSRVSVLLFKTVLVLTVFSGLYGTFLHLRANYEFEQEMQPTASAWHLFVDSLSGALPTLAPGSMIVLALIGYVYLILLKQHT
ncbi:hypothetical protein PP178_02725 [Zeaxanthinibacter sp. PT1]|uniref:hypothetical protein n=1 Tax=Zeaxanthinibacter TaxID=561554 RepID=UPI002349E397|nr:hypothetical protein [Zeaxanthinibacter sp. PT1]MDC6350450.1 hypothetical protein [Zeaxanthinibacter sp. PT1]